MYYQQPQYAVQSLQQVESIALRNYIDARLLSLFLLRCNSVSCVCSSDHAAMSAPEFLDFCKHLVSPYGIYNITLERSTVIHALHYMFSLVESNSGIIENNACATCILVTCLVIATKFVQENGRRSNLEWARLANMKMGELNQLERQVLHLLGFDLLLPLAKYNELETLLSQDFVVSSWIEGPINKPHNRCDGSSFCCGSNMSNTLLAPRSVCTTPTILVDTVMHTSEHQFQYTTPPSAPDKRKISTVLEYSQILRQLRLC
ncbi:hypothetical protein SARC_12867 [Sphaeroforma arctica JP610]|uniref:Cyclin N-terminal domain-containing protein n=1 Tax=Sphaeroforma arctica JP610 TaxID=667725 RepID=A0A0L0FDR4_9EUKA|nr:hypothetical protein SARC_12867 [Sphaeroforma arctica JP610]KNC74591.1 hypothetical protein SARC_12867 [Sphaeroforma arctica JP610]|eukprot:XP_014148493.1 hypothetical protein SARC_12867 [Sphaeroforma arctica JP610]